jgi:hypothetical protein
MIKHNQGYSYGYENVQLTYPGDEDQTHDQHGMAVLALM